MKHRNAQICSLEYLL